MSGAPHPDAWTPAFSRDSAKARPAKPRAKGLSLERLFDYPLSRLLLVVNLALAALIALRLFAPSLALLPNLHLGGPPSVSLPNPSASATVDLAPAGSFTAIAERPLFLEDRRKPKDPPPPETLARALITPPPTVTLDGVTPTGIVTAGDHRVALLKTPDGQAPTAVREGDDFRGWHVVRIEAQAIVFTTNGEERRIAFPKPATTGGITMGNPDTPEPAQPK